jgi:hypothetical protein
MNESIFKLATQVYLSNPKITIRTFLKLIRIIDLLIINKNQE